MAIRTLYGWLGHGVAVVMTAVALFACPVDAVAAAGDEDRLVTRNTADEAPATAGVYLLLVNGNNRYTAGDATMMAQIRRLYLGQQGTWPDARAALPLGRPADSAAQGALRRLILGMSRDALEAHWLRRNAATGAPPPRVVAEMRELVRAIARGDGAFGVVAADEATRLPAGVRVLFRFSLHVVAGGGTISPERLFWQSIETSTDPAGFQAYLGAFPGGAYADLARARLDALTGAPAARLKAQEDVAVVASLP